jgi:hypothetical protein
MLRKAVISAAVATIAIASAALIINRLQKRTVSLDGVTLIQDADVKRQAPISGVLVTAGVGTKQVHGRSDSGGAFHLVLPREVWNNLPIELQFRHSGYEPLNIRESLPGQIFVARMTAINSNLVVNSPAPETTLKDVRVRYASKATTPVNVGSMARTFEVVNVGNIPCDKAGPCSPDGKWKATDGGFTLDAGEGHEFQSVRISCIAGPCPFTQIDSNQSLRGGRTVKISVRNWSDTATFLVEAEVIQTMLTDLIRNAYPAIFGREMSFTLPPTSQGPSIEADTNGANIVYPLGPELTLSWAVCNLQIGADRTKLYRCELKPGYRFE